MSEKYDWQQWLNENSELLIMLAAYEISPEAVISQRALLQANGKNIDETLYANILELAHLRQRTYWQKTHENE